MTNEEPKASALSGFISAAGFILGVSYPVLALSTGFRAVFQLLEGEQVNTPWLTLLAALFYLLATVGFFRRSRWAWRLSVGVLSVETLFTIIVGTLSFVAPDLIGRNVWQYFGRDYGYFPFIQPLLGLAWLFHPQTLRAYGQRQTPNLS